jgi:hypothetical protein
VEESGFWGGMAIFCVSVVLGMEIERRMMSTISDGGDQGYVAWLSHHGHGSCLRVYPEMVICLLNDFGGEAGSGIDLLNVDAGGEGSVKAT